MLEQNLVQYEAVYAIFVKGVKDWFGIVVLPKFHNVGHFPHTIRRLGPMTLMSTGPFECKHKELNSAADKNSNMSQLLRFLARCSMETFVYNWDNGSHGSSPRVSAKLVETTVGNETMQAAQFYIDQYEYRPGLFVMAGPNSNEVFEIRDLLLSADDDREAY